MRHDYESTNQKIDLVIAVLKASIASVKVFKGFEAHLRLKPPVI